MSTLNKIFSCCYRGMQLDCMQGDIVMAETDAVAIVCDPDFTLNFGIGKSIRSIAGLDFMNKLREARCRQPNPVVLSVPITSGVRANLALLAPVRRPIGRASLDQVYIAIIQKAIELRLESVTMPLLGTGGLQLTFEIATKHMQTGLSHFMNFGQLRKLQFVDQDADRMRSLRSFILVELIGNSTTPNGRQQSCSSSSSAANSSFQALGSGTVESPVQLYQRAVTSGSGRTNGGAGTSAGTSRARTRGTTSSAAGDDLGREETSLLSALRPRPCHPPDPAAASSTDDEMEGGESVGERTQRRIRRALMLFDGDNPGIDDYDLETSSDDGTFEPMTAGSDVMSEPEDPESASEEDSGSSDDDVALGMDDDEDGIANQQELTKEQEARFWAVVPLEQLIGGGTNEEAGTEDKPSTSETAAKVQLASKSGRTMNGIIGSESQQKSRKSRQSSSSSSMRHPNVLLDDSSLPCSICLGDMREDDGEGERDVVVQMALCSHMFHKQCIKSAFKVKKQCPLCMLWYGEFIGYQPADATMNVRQVPGKVPGYRDAKGFHEITYYIPAGVQTEGHIRPGQRYRSTTRIAYLPNNAEGTRVLKLLQLAFKRRLIFTIGDSVTSGRRNVPVWNNIHHKTNKDGGSQSYGYPDAGYLDRVQEELTMVGVRADQLH